MSTTDCAMLDTMVELETGLFPVLEGWVGTSIQCTHCLHSWQVLSPSTRPNPWGTLTAGSWADKMAATKTPRQTLLSRAFGLCCFQAKFRLSRSFKDAQSQTRDCRSSGLDFGLTANNLEQTRYRGNFVESEQDSFNGTSIPLSNVHRTPKTPQRRLPYRLVCCAMTCLRYFCLYIAVPV